MPDLAALEVELEDDLRGAREWRVEAKDWTAGVEGSPLAVSVARREEGVGEEVAAREREREGGSARAGERSREAREGRAYLVL